MKLYNEHYLQIVGGKLVMFLNTRSMKISYWIHKITGKDTKFNQFAWPGIKPHEYTNLILTYAIRRSPYQYTSTIRFLVQFVIILSFHNNISTQQSNLSNNRISFTVDCFFLGYKLYREIYI